MSATWVSCDAPGEDEVMKLEVQRIRRKAESTTVTFRVDDRDASGISDEIRVKVPTQASMDKTIAAAHQALASFGAALAKAASQ
jgi:hypothetical protein